MAERDIAQIEVQQLRTLLQNKPPKTRRLKLKVNAVLIDNVEALEAIKVREEETINKQSNKRKRAPAATQKKDSAQIVLRGQKKRREVVLEEALEEEEGSEADQEDVAAHLEDFDKTSRSDSESVHSVINVRRT